MNVPWRGLWNCAVAVALVALMAEARIIALETALATLTAEVAAARQQAVDATSQVAAAEQRAADAVTAAEQRAADAEAQQARGSVGGGLVDTRLLGRPRTFKGGPEDWRPFKFQFVGYAGAVSLRLRGILLECETAAEAETYNAVQAFSTRRTFFEGR